MRRIVGYPSTTTFDPALIFTGNEEVITLSKIFIHPQYNSKTIDNDIALVKLSKPVKYTKYIRPACIPASGSKVKAGADAFVSGWGTTSEGGSTSPILQVAKVTRENTHMS